LLETIGRFPATPAISICHDSTIWYNEPVDLPSVRHLAVDPACRDRITSRFAHLAERVEILHNAVDVNHFTPAVEPPPDGPVLLLGGDQTQAYRLELGLRTFARVLESEPFARLLVTGRLVSPAEPLIDELGLRGRVDLVGRYSQRDAPDVMRRAHLLLHTKVQDPCPSVVIEAMSCGLPVVYPASGGTPELVGEEAGIGVQHPTGWERDEPPAPEELATAVLRVLDDRPRYSGAARSRAVDNFDLAPWLERHGELFNDLLVQRQRR